MKKKTLAVLALAAVLAVVPTFSFAARSSSVSGGHSSSSGTTTQNTAVQPGAGVSGTSTASTTKELHVSTDGTVVTATGNTIDKSGTNIGLVVDTTISTGVAVTSNNDGSISIGTVKIHFANGDAETAGLPADVVEKINQLNQGSAINDVVGTAAGVDLTGYTAVGNTRAVIATDSATGLTNTATEVIFHVASVDASEMAAVYYDNNTGKWVVVPVIVDPVTKTVKITVPGSCTVQLMKKAAI